MRQANGKSVPFALIVDCALTPEGTIVAGGLRVAGLPPGTPVPPLPVLGATLLQALHAILMGQAQKDQTPLVVVPGMRPPEGIPGVG